MMQQAHNPVIGYVIVDKTRHVIGPPGITIDPVFHSKKNAIAAAEKYGRKEDIHDIVEEYLEGIFNVVIRDEGDIMLDGQSAQRFCKACKKRGLRPNKKLADTVNLFEKENKYSARELLADVDANRDILLKEP